MALSFTHTILGFCEMTPDNRNCEVGQMGSWSTQLKGAIVRGSRPIGNLSACAARCKECSRCRYVSYSLQHRDCSWFNDCRVQHTAGGKLQGGQPVAGTQPLGPELRMLRYVPTGWDYVTLRVR